ncbi:hypothetical protein FRC07_004967 [Ceratobasidium sp. 392]|nr:hypothetical protein FRC07_004967 [Ceratobasidium sp. 392]
MSSPDPKRAPKRAPLASVPRLNVDGNLGAHSQVGHATFSGVSSLLSGPLKKKYKARDSSTIGDESILEEGPELDESAGKPRTRARTMSFQRGNLPNLNVNFNLPKEDHELVTPRLSPGTSSAWPDTKESDEQDLDQEIFNSMVSHTSFSIEGTGAGGGGGGGMPDTPVKKAVFGNSSVGVGGGPIAMGGARGWMTSLPDRGAKAFGGRNAPRPSLPISFPGHSPDSPDESPAAGRSKLPTIDSSESPTTRPFWNPSGADESPSLRPRRKSGENSGLARRKSGGGDISLNLGVRKQKPTDSPKRPPLGPQRRSYGSVGLGRPNGRERDPIPKFSFEESRENGLGLSTGNEKPATPLTASTSANSFLSASTSLGVMPFMRRASSGTFSSDGEASVNGTPTRRGGVPVGGGMRAPARPAQPVGARLTQAAGAAPGRSSLPVANWRLVTPSPSLSSLASMDTPSAPARKVARASPILSKGKRASVPLPAFHPPTAAVVEPEPTVTLGRLEREYTTVQQIGKGTFGQVLKVEKDGRLFAVKRSKAFEGVRHRRRVLEEADILQHLATGGGHSNVLKFVDAWEQDGRSLILTEMCELGNLADFLVEWGERFARLDEPRVWKLASDLSHGLAFIHAAGVIHLDLKPANMFVTIEGRIRIGDFGMAARWPRPASDSEGFEREGDRDYMAPEILQGVYGFEADVFSLGMTLLECATNIIVPAMGEPWHKLRNDDFSDVDLDGFSPELISVISGMMRREAGQRPSMALVCAHECIVRTEAIMTRAIESARASATEATGVFRASPFGSEGPAFLEEVLGHSRDGEGMDMS